MASLLIPAAAEGRGRGAEFFRKAAGKGANRVEAGGDGDIAHGKGRPQKQACGHPQADQGQQLGKGAVEVFLQQGRDGGFPDK